VSEKVVVIKQGGGKTWSCCAGGFIMWLALGVACLVALGILMS